jgi:hypothetical protein
MTPFRYQDDLAVGRLYGFLGRESECVVVRNWYVPLLRWLAGATARRLPFSPHVETDRPRRGVGSRKAKHFRRLVKEIGSRVRGFHTLLGRHAGLMRHQVGRGRNAQPLPLSYMVPIASTRNNARSMPFSS